MQFSLEQDLAFEKYLRGENVFLTGPGGTGKTELIRRIYRHAMEHNKGVQVCALTGCAAVLLECKAKTVHSWAGIGLGNGPIAANVEKVKRNKHSASNWKSTSILVVDEVSMMSKKMFDMLNNIGNAVRSPANSVVFLPTTQHPRSRKRHFGNLQLIFSGDFFQLPPVGNKEEPATGQFCFESSDWFDVFPPENHIVLKRIFRQNDQQYQQILNQIREGRLKRSSNDKLLSLVNRTDQARCQPTKLLPTRKQVDLLNATKMNELAGPTHEYRVTHILPKLFSTPWSQEELLAEAQHLERNLLCDSTIHLRVGAQVMCIVNKPDLVLCNGSRGTVVGFSSSEGAYPVVEFTNGHRETMVPHVWSSEHIPEVQVAQVPLILAWALTIHKSQGATLNEAEIDVGSNVFECGQTYVAMSRVKSMEGLFLQSFDAGRIKVNSKVQEFYSHLDELLNRKRKRDEEEKNVEEENETKEEEEETKEDEKETKEEEKEETKEETKEEDENNRAKKLRLGSLEAPASIQEEENEEDNEKEEENNEDEEKETIDDLVVNKVN